MDTSRLTQATVRAAIEALQRGDSAAWLEQFEPGAWLTDDGAARSFGEFTRRALGHERFVAIETVDADGLEISGRFHSDRWADFRTYFHVTLGARGTIRRLDIGQL